MFENRNLRALALCLGLALVASSSMFAQAPDETAKEPAAPPTELPPGEPEPAKEAPRKRHFGLYLAVAWGGASADELNTSVNTTTRLRSINALEFDEVDHGRAAVGWRFPEGKGDLRMLFNGYRETGYKLKSTGERTSVRNLTPNSSFFTDCIPANASFPCYVVWNELTIQDGVLSASTYEPSWNGEINDTDGDGAADESEIVLTPATNLPNFQAARTLNNQVASIDVLYGREFGTRRFSSHWWAGLRHFEYEGNTLHPAWLGTSAIGFPTGSGYPPILALHQELSGIGPSGAWEVDFNFFEKRLVLYALAQAAFSFNSSDVDSGDFFTFVAGTDPQQFAVPTRLQESRDKSTWSNRLEFGVRARLIEGLYFEGGFSRTGFLDAVLIPSDLAIPENSNQINRGVTALFSTQDLVFDAWHAGVAYQF